MSNTISLIIFSDAHGKLEYVKKILSSVKENVDAIVFCGDIAPYRQHISTLQYITMFLSYVSSFKVTKVIAVPGNVDYLEHYIEASKKSDMFINIHENIYVYKEYLFAGFGGSNITPFNTILETPDEIIEQKLEASLQRAKNLNKNLNKLILVTHTPPYNTKCDLAYNGQHIGSTAVRKIIEKYKPIVAISGHVHESRCIDKIEETVIVNPGPLSRGFYAMIKINDNVKAELKQVY
ncbi:metallophosphoesterase [Ignisphaera sp. 4213-co]|uniref:Metallophosphoesterase n=1 Tax=Ignisphaera cupida TaxID=3050454 RepID=A0ABD4Z5L1_9CREN|nr:metallophosphoesterase [Ignisphaera sp. 4213-co]MDK6028404.1 metallophosphoesterase [Ignisphaera sp. 4213-co]